MAVAEPAKPDILRVGTRRSALARTQTQFIVARLSSLHSTTKIEVVEVLTTGDQMLDASLANMPDKGVFVKEIEDKLLAGEIDLAVHSMKDMPTELPRGLKIGAYPERADPRDVLVTRLATDLREMANGATIGTGSARRQAQLLQYRSDLNVCDIRGNIDTRLKKARTPEYDGIILAAAGLARMGWLEQVREYLSCSVMIPAVGQGTLGIEIREDDRDVERLVAPLNDPSAEKSCQAERTFLAGMGGGCHTPMAAFCRVRDEAVSFQAFASNTDGSDFRKASIDGHLDDAVTIAAELVSRLQSS